MYPDVYSVMILKLAVNRMNLHRLRKAESSLKTKKEIGELLEQGKPELARVRVRIYVHSTIKKCKKNSHLIRPSE
jgi:hypothetical protein